MHRGKLPVHFLASKIYQVASIVQRVTARPLPSRLVFHRSHSISRFSLQFCVMNGGRDKCHVTSRLFFRKALFESGNAGLTPSFVKTRNESRIKLPGLEFLIANNLAEVRQRSFYAANSVLIKRAR